MDIEGSEIEGLEGMEKILRKDVKLAIAALHSMKGEPTYKTIIPQLEYRGFDVCCTDEGLVCAKRIPLSNFTANLVPKSNHSGQST